jgi:sarcosine oxidase
VRAVVVGAGAWGLPAAAELARRGHQVSLVEAHEVGHPLGSSSGPSRLWRLSHAEPRMVRLAQRSVQAWERLERRSERTLLLRRGLLWRADSAAAVASALGAEGVSLEEVAAADVARWFPGLRPNGVDAVWQDEAGPVLAREALAAQLGVFLGAGGQLLSGLRAVEFAFGSGRVELRLTGSAGPAEPATVEADVLVVAAGPWAPELLPALGVELDLVPVLEQVAYFYGGSGPDPEAWQALPCLYDGATADDVGLYAMPTPGFGYKVGLDQPLRRFDPEDVDRTPTAERDRQASARVARDFGALDPTVVSSHVCTWTMSPDGEFVVDRLLDGQVVLATGDSGTGFKFSALMGELLADLAEGRDPDPDVAPFGLARFADGVPEPPPYGVFGRPPAPSAEPG